MVHLACNKCCKSYTTRSSLNRHLAIHKNVDHHECNICGKKYEYRNSLRRHIRLIHLNLSNKNFECSDCGKKYLYKCNLRSHVYSIHVVGKGNDEPDGNFECHECGRKYHYKRSLKYHIAKSHYRVIKCHRCGEEFQCKSDLKWHVYSTHSVYKLLRERKAFTCLLCCKSLSSEFHILIHYKDVHKLEILTENHSLGSQEQFNIWKSDIETQHRCTYIKKDLYKNVNTNKRTVLFQCNRSGFYRPPQSRKRKLKIQGSKKLNGFCPSKIVVHITVDGVHEVQFTKTHIGHGNDYKQLAHMNYSSELKETIAKKLKSGIPAPIIVADIVPSSSGSKPKDSLDKIDLLSEKDVYNIAASFNIKVKRPNRFLSNNIGIEAWTAANKESVYFYKRQGEVDQSKHGLHQDDFVLVFMKNEQVEEFERYSSNVILVDGTHCISKEANFLLHTVVVVDEFGEGYPTCFLITNRNDALVFDVMFSCIREKFGVVCANVLMSDVQISCWDSWVRIMGIQPEYHLYCAWHVIRAWQKNYAKVKSSEKKKTVSRRLLKLLYEDNVASFHHLFEQFLNDNDEDLRPFILYFRDMYGSNYEKWAHCYHLRAGINTNMRLERFHRVFKYSQSHGLTIAQVQDTLTHLDKLMFRKACSDMRANVTGEKLGCKIQALKRDHNHEKAISYVNSCEIIQIDEKMWKIESLKEEIDDEYEENDEGGEAKSYLLEKIKDDCPDCPMLCKDCYFCSHQFRCSCLQNAIKNTMCKHIHLLCMTKMLHIVPIYSAGDSAEEIKADGVEVVDNNDECFQNDMVPYVQEDTILLEPVAAQAGETFNEQQTCKFENRKQQLVAELEELVDEACGDDSIYVTLQNFFKSIRCTIESVKSLNNSPDKCVP